MAIRPVSRPSGRAGAVRTLRRMLGGVLLGLLVAAAPGLVAGQSSPTRGEAEQAYRDGFALQRQRRTLEAMAAYRQALQVKPDYAEAHQNLGMGYLITGNFKNGWPEYEWRWKTSNELFRPRSFSQPP